MAEKIRTVETVGNWVPGLKAFKQKASCRLHSSGFIATTTFLIPLGYVLP